MTKKPKKKPERKKANNSLPLYDSGFTIVNGVRKPVLRIRLHDYTFKLNFLLIVSDWMVAWYLVQRHTWGWGYRDDCTMYEYVRRMTHMSPEKMLGAKKIGLMISEE